MRERARKSKLETWKAEDKGASFLGSKDFPPDLVATCLKFDPKGILVGTGSIPASLDGSEDAIKKVLDERLVGKRLLLCSGADDRLVPYAKSEKFVRLLEDANKTWYGGSGFVLESKVYDGVGHSFSVAMVKDALRFIVEALVAKDRDMAGQTDAKI